MHNQSDRRIVIEPSAFGRRAIVRFEPPSVSTPLMAFRTPKEARAYALQVSRMDGLSIDDRLDGEETTL